MRARLRLPLAIGVGAVASAALLDAKAVQAAPSAELWPRWQAHDPTSDRQVEHASYAALLQLYLHEDANGVMRVRYGALKAERRQALADYVASLAAVDPDRLTRAEQMAYWINFYNALTLDVVVEHYPVASIRDIDISPGLFSQGPWRRKLVSVNGEALSLDDIEHRILRPIWRDPRIHYAVNCASVGCPNLQPQPFAASRLETMLEGAAHAYVNDPRGVTMATGLLGGRQLTASRIYDWFQVDFGGSEAGVIEHLRRHGTAATQQLLAGVETIDAYRYDWSLNDSQL
jgi:hypothetical protein